MTKLLASFRLWINKSDVDLNETSTDRKVIDEIGDAVSPLNNDSRNYHELINEKNDREEIHELQQRIAFLEKKFETMKSKDE